MLKTTPRRPGAAESGATDVFGLRVPAHPSFGQLAAVAALGLAKRRNFSVDAARTLSTAASAAAECLIGPSPRFGRLYIKYEIRSNSILVNFELRGGLRRGKIAAGRLLAFRSGPGRRVDDWGSHRNQLWFLLHSI